MSADFPSLSLSQPLLTVVQELGYETLTEIQASAIPLLLEGKDVVGQSQTGSGKTAAFVLPILQKLQTEERRLQAIVLCPTRELSAQVARETRKLGRRCVGLQVLTLCGGEPFGPQAKSLERGVHVVVGTPGRVLDHVGRNTLDLSGIATVVLDEADRMLDMGFRDEMESVLRALPAKRQTVLFSATFPPTIKSLSKTFQREAQHITVSGEEEVPDITQHLVVTDPAEKMKALCWALGEYPHESALVFCNQKATIRDIHRELSRGKVSVGELHGDLEQYHRDQMLAQFRNGSVRVLVATDVAARGIDVEDLDLVINYDLPTQPEVYQHRIGRTGRAGRAGVAVSFSTPREAERVQAIEVHTGTQLQRQKVPQEHRGDVRALAAAVARPAAMETVQISGGRKDKVRPGDILGALTGEAGGLQGQDVGKIEVQDRLSYVAVAADASDRAVSALNRGRIKGKRFRATLIR